MLGDPILHNDQDGSPVPTTQRTGLLLPYRVWSPRSLHEVSFATVEQIIDGLFEIVTSEGPMHALRAYQLYVKASGGQRVGKEIRRTFNQAISNALRSGRLAQLNDRLPGQVDKTLYTPGSEPVVVRELGPRQLFEMPRSEVNALSAAVGASGPSDEGKRAVLDALGLTRLTERVSAYLAECDVYEWTR